MRMNAKEREEKTRFPLSVGYAPANTAQYAVSLDCCQGTPLTRSAANHLGPPGTGLHLRLLTTEIYMNFFAELET